MKNEIVNKLRSHIKIKIQGKNGERFIRKLVLMKIELLLRIKVILLKKT